MKIPKHSYLKISNDRRSFNGYCFNNSHLRNNYYFSKMTQQHPVVPTKYLIDAWCQQYSRQGKGFSELLIEAAQWGADIELEECCALFKANSVCGTKFQRESSVRALRNKRRPMPKQTTLTVSITGTEDELEQLIRNLKDDQQISIKF